MLSSRAILAAVVGAALSASSAFALDCTRSYNVASGDTCDAISSTQHVSTYQLAVLNPNIDDGCGNLAIGEPLCLGTPAADCNNVYTVVAGDSCLSVSAAHNINTTLLWANNPQLDAECDNLYIGEVVCVEGAYNVPSLAPGQKPVPTTVPAGAQPAKAAKKVAVSSSSAAPTTAAPTTSVVPTTSSAAPTHSASALPDDDEDLPWCEEGDDGY